MTTDTAFWLLVVAVAALVWVAARFAAYRVHYRYTDEDLAMARKQSIRSSRVTRDGQAAEHLAPFLPGLYDSFSPKDARFIGNPIDFVVFDGLDAGELRRVVFVEVKSGARAELNRRQRGVRRAVEEAEVEFRVIRLDTDVEGRALSRRRAP
jgi:predicted Holliday junction resolvase-like endonuclease